MKQRISLILLALLPACSTGLGGFEVEVPDVDPIENPVRAELGLGFDPGVTLSAPIDEGVEVFGLRVPGAAEGEERNLVLLAFSTATPADDADGNATPLVQDGIAPVDQNGQSDVFLAVVEDQLFETEIAGVQPLAFDRGLVNVFRHTRCVTCHAVGHEAPEGELTGFPFETGFAHPGDQVAGGDPSVTSEDPLLCATCHNQAQVADIGRFGVEWRAPLPITAVDFGIPFEFDLRGKTVEELNARASSLDPDIHMLIDTRIRWAIESGRVPDLASEDPAGILASSSPGWAERDVEVGPVPIEYATFLGMVEAWEQGGFQATSAGAVQDLVLVSQSMAGQAANGTSRAPAIGFTPNPAFMPGVDERFGTVVCAYASDATNLTNDVSPVDGNGDPIDDVFLSRVDVFVTDSGVDLVTRSTDTILVSETAGGGSGANDVSGEPDIDASGVRVIYSSRATDLTAGFIDGNAGEDDVFAAAVDLAAGQVTSTVLWSRTSGNDSQGGDGASRNPSISSDGIVIAFESEATDLVADDTNAVTDIFCAEIATNWFDRVSVRTDGVEGTGGDCRDASIVKVNGGAVVAFESDKIDLTDDVLAATTNVYLRVHDETTTLLSQELAGGSSTPGNGISTEPRMDPAGAWVIFTTEADNLDTILRDDENEVADVILVDTEQFFLNGEIRGRRLTVSSLQEDGSAASRAPEAASFIDPNGELQDGFMLFRTEAENLGRGPSTDLVGIFLNNDAVLVATDFSADPERLLVGETVQFQDLSSEVEGASFAWDFGDGTTSTEVSPSHAYAERGTFDVVLTVTRGDGEEASTVSVTRQVEVLKHPGAVFTASPEVGFTPLMATFTHAPESPDGLDEAVFVWIVGDDEPVEDDAEFTAEVLNPGVQDLLVDVRLEVTLLGRTETSTRTLTVQPPANAAFNLARTAEAPVALTLVDQTAEMVQSLTWTIEKDDVFFVSSTDDPFTTDPLDPGTYVVELEVMVGGQLFSSEKTIEVTPITWLEDIFTVGFSGNFWNQCNGCHTGGSPQGELLLDLTMPQESHDDLVGVDVFSDTCGSGLKRVTAGDETNSLLLDLIDPDFSDCTESSPGSPVNMPNVNVEADFEKVLNWIKQGAIFSDA